MMGLFGRRVRVGTGTRVLLGLGILGLVLIVVRFARGLGATTNLSDAYPWGFWIGVDVLVGIALAAGGFVMAGVVHVFGGERYHALTRPAILTALLGYLLFISALMVDLGRPWNIWKALISWNHQSPMFEVAWCVMFYTAVLLMEFTPAVLERLRWRATLVLWRELVPFLVLVMLTLFSFAMTGSLAWAGVTLTILLGWEALMRTGRVMRDHQMPLLLIAAGVTLSTLHQSSLGTLFLVVDRMGPLWYTPILPALFFVSAVIAAPAVVILEATLSSQVLHRHSERALLGDLARRMPDFIAVYLVLRVGDILIRGAVFPAMSLSFQGLWWWLEVGLLVTAMALFSIPELAWRRHGLLAPAAATVLAVVAHRLGVSLVGISAPGYPPYVPAWTEVAITVGVLALGILGFRWAVTFLPIYEDPRLGLPAPLFHEERLIPAIPDEMQPPQDIPAVAS